MTFRDVRAPLEGPPVGGGRGAEGVAEADTEVRLGQGRQPGRVRDREPIASHIGAFAARLQGSEAGR